MYSLTVILNSAPTHSHPLPPISTHSHPPPLHCHPLPLTDIHSTYYHLLPPTLTHLQPTPTHFSAFSHPLPLMFNPLLLISNILPPMRSLFHQSPVHSLHTLTQSNPSPTIPTHIQSFVLCANVLVCLCAFVFPVPMCLCNSFLCTLLLMSVYFTCFSMC